MPRCQIAASSAASERPKGTLLRLAASPGDRGAGLALWRTDPADVPQSPRTAYATYCCQHTQRVLGKPGSIAELSRVLRAQFRRCEASSECLGRPTPPPRTHLLLPGLNHGPGPQPDVVNVRAGQGDGTHWRQMIVQLAARHKLQLPDEWSEPLDPAPDQDADSEAREHKKDDPR